MNFRERAKRRLEARKFHLLRRGKKLLKIGARFIHQRDFNRGWEYGFFYKPFPQGKYHRQPKRSIAFFIKGFADGRSEANSLKEYEVVNETY